MQGVNMIDPTQTLDASSTGCKMHTSRVVGDLLIKIGAMTGQQVKYVLRVQAEGDSRRFGEIAFSLHYLRDDSIKRYIDYLEKWMQKNYSSQL